jgi:hypothetical protein
VWAETVYHRRGHSETGQAPLQRWADGWAGKAPPLPSPARLHEAFLWSERRTVPKTATVSLHGNPYQVDPSLAGRGAELVFDPFDLSSLEVRWQGRPAGQAAPHVIGRHAHPRVPGAGPAGILVFVPTSRRGSRRAASAATTTSTRRRGSARPATPGLAGGWPRKGWEFTAQVLPEAAPAAFGGGVVMRPDLRESMRT